MRRQPLHSKLPSGDCMRVFVWERGGSSALLKMLADVRMFKSFFFSFLFRMEPGHASALFNLGSTLHTLGQYPVP